MMNSRSPDPRLDPEFQAFAENNSEWIDQSLRGERRTHGHTLAEALATGLGGGESPEQVAMAWTLMYLADPKAQDSGTLLRAISRERQRQGERSDS